MCAEIVDRKLVEMRGKVNVHCMYIEKIQKRELGSGKKVNFVMDMKLMMQVWLAAKLTLF